ncbi:MAG: hypothetical protein LPK19_01740, partial [Hymenobacteraceae bacterium]|nr:hypothetical protein [Hymenobacteraceae bacterium]MDX5394896.1 hypothetical protein [Hymenobacteraceae bacterium]MDX5510932.1 hypothetical protein [Hymenobacteraceae bacterium]
NELGRNYSNDNPYGVRYVDRTDYNSGRHFDPRADYSNSDYSRGRDSGRGGYNYGGSNRDFGHEVNYNTEGFQNRSPYQADYESNQRYNRPHHRHPDRGPHRSNDSRMHHSYGPTDAYRHSPDLRNHSGPDSGLQRPNRGYWSNKDIV